MTRNDLRLLVVVGVLLLMAFAEESFGIAAFARKHELSCQTCHIAYPKLNAYGTAFRNLGYRLPGESAEEEKNPDLPLGAPAYKRVWPKAVWPGGLPSQAPLTLNTEFLVEDSRTIAADGDETRVETQFLMPSAVELIAGGTAGEIISYFGELAFTQELEDDEVTSEAAVEHFDLRFVRPFRQSSAFNFKLGAFQPELVETFDHARRLTVANYDSMFGVDPYTGSVGGGGHHGGDALSLPAVVRGLEAYGIVRGRFDWALGLVSGLGPGGGVFDGNSSKDLYGRVGWKWGGLALDGSNADSFAGQRKNWRERSLRVNLFFYEGDSSDIFNALEDEHGGDEGQDEHSDSRLLIGSAATEDEEHEGEGDDHEAEGEHAEAAFWESDGVTRWGIDFNWFFDDLNVFGAWVSGEDDITTFAADDHGLEAIPESSGTFEYQAWFLEADVVLGYPWLHAALRYENVDLDDGPGGLVRPDWKRATVSMTALVRANVKTVLEHTWDPDESRDRSTWLGFGIVF